MVLLNIYVYYYLLALEDSHVVYCATD
jgi:hypothetical protein